MNRGIYATASGMVVSQQWMDTITNNLANASTTGFKRDSLNFNEAMLRQMSLGKQNVGSIGSGPAANETYTIFEQGSLINTGNPLDVSITSEHGLFGVQVGNDTRYTRAGNFALDQDRTLVTQDGYPVLSDGGQPITLPQGEVAIADDGNVQVNGQPVAKIGVFDTDRTDKDDLGFQKIGGNLYAALRQANPIDGHVRQGVIEASNVNAVDSMVQMIAMSRVYEMSQRSIQSQDELSQRLIQSLQDR